jgi:hypothetical protein
MCTDKTDPLKPKPQSFLIRAGREIRGQNSLSNGGGAGMCGEILNVRL